MRDYNLKMIDMAQANTEGVFEFARQLATAKAPSDLVELWTSHARKQLEMLNEQIKELTAIGQKMASESAEPIARSVGDALIRCPPLGEEKKTDETLTKLAQGGVNQHAQAA